MILEHTDSAVRGGSAGPGPVAPQAWDETRDWLEDYAAGFRRDGANRTVEVVLDHSRRVADEMRALAGELRVPAPVRELAALLGLLHDIGRFDHAPGGDFFCRDAGRRAAEQGAAVLREEGVPRTLSPGLRDLLHRCILVYHECICTSRGEAGTVTLLVTLLHDADRLDNWRIALREYRHANGCRTPALRHGLDDSPGCSLRVRDRVTAGRPVDPRDVRNLNDLRLLQLGWVFDVHYPRTLERIRTRHVVDDLRRSLHGCPGLDPLFERARAHVEGGDR